MTKVIPAKLLVILTIFFLFGIHSVFAKSEGELAAGMVNPGHAEHPEWFKVSFLELEENFSQREISDKTQQYFDVVSINLWGDKEVTVGDKTYTEKEFAEALKVQYTPTLLFFNEDNKIAFRANGYYPPEKFSALLDYIGKKQEGGLSYQDYMAKVNPQPSTGKLHDDINSVSSVSDLRYDVRAEKMQHL